MACFLDELDVELVGDSYWRLKAPLRYTSILTGMVMIPVGFETDFASVPRLPWIFTIWGDRAHREAVLHDYLYCTDAVPDLDFATCNRVFLEAMKSRGVFWMIRYPMYWGVCLFGKPCYKKRSVIDNIEP